MLQQYLYVNNIKARNLKPVLLTGMVVLLLIASQTYDISYFVLHLRFEIREYHFNVQIHNMYFKATSIQYTLLTPARKYSAYSTPRLIACLRPRFIHVYYFKCAVRHRKRQTLKTRPTVSFDLSFHTYFNGASYTQNSPRAKIPFHGRVTVCSSL